MPSGVGETGGGGWECGCREMLSKRISECGAEGGGDYVLLRKGAGRLWFSSVAALVAQGIAVRVGMINGTRERGRQMLREHLEATQHIDPSSISLVASVRDFLRKTSSSEPEAHQK